MSFKKKRTKTKPVLLSRKEKRKEARKQKKVRRNDYFSHKKPTETRAAVASGATEPVKQNAVQKKKEIVAKNNEVTSIEKIRIKDQKEQKQIQKDLNKERRKQLLQANVEEDQNIKRLEKQLKLNKRKTKTIAKSFATDGLDYLLEVCDPDTMKSAVTAEQQLHEINDEFEEDFALMTGKKVEKTIRESDDEEENFDDIEMEESDDEEELEMGEDEDTDDLEEMDDDEEIDTEDDYSEQEESFKKVEDSEPKSNKRKNSEATGETKKKKVVHFSEENDAISSESEPEDKSEDTWEDIYGRMRSKDGSVIKSTEEKYIPPAIRAKMEAELPEEKKRLEKLSRLRKQLKGLLNRLAESNMHNIANQIEELYMNNSRNDMNDTMTNLILESIVSHVIAPERLLMEHVMLMAILHANVGTEVGAHFLQTVVKKFDEFFKAELEVEDKTLDNVVNILAQLYNFKLFDSKLLYEVLKKLSEKFQEKDVECILHILRSVGFGLRKDDPLALKSLIFDLQKQASNVPEETRDNSRVKFMLDILLAIKNNNVTKIPNYDTTYSEHLKKIMKGFIRKGNYVTQLNISLDDLLKADERGKWWVVGSAWTGNVTEKTKEIKSDGFSKKLLELAKKQRMNTDTRRNIFCIIMSAEDYLDAFEKLLRLGLKNQQEREIIHVILHCCLQEKQYNPYYGILAQKFCDHDRKYQMTIKYSVWDKLKALNDHSSPQISNLAKLLIHLFMEKGLPISTLKIVQFSELDKLTLRFMRQILLGILLHKDQEACQEVFAKVAQSEKLKMFRDSLRLFIHHFLLKNLDANGIPEKEKMVLENRAKMVEMILLSKQIR